MGVEIVIVTLPQDEREMKIVSHAVWGLWKWFVEEEKVSSLLVC